MSGKETIPPVPESDETPDIIIRRTIGGMPVDDDNPTDECKKTPPPPPAKRHNDPFLWGIYITLLIISIVELYSASSSEVTADHIYGPLVTHGRYLLLGFLIVLGLQKVHYKYFRKLALPFAVLCLGLIMISTFFGITINGAQRAIGFAGMTVQPAEIAKLSVVMLLAAILAKYQMAQGVKWSGVWQCAIVVVVFCGALWANGLTNMLLLMSVSIAMFLIGGMQSRRFFIVLGIYAVFGSMLVGIKYMGNNEEEVVMADGTVIVAEQGAGRASTHKGRLKRWWDGVEPNDTIDDMNRQEIFAKFAQAHGGIINVPGNSRESARLPLAFSDYIYSIIVEDTGFVGGVILLIIYLLLIARAGWVASLCSRAFPALLIMGCAVLIVFQALVHMAIVTGVFPVSGQPLPLISKGGTSIVVMSAAIGMMMSVSRFAVVTGNRKEINKELRELSSDMHSANPMDLKNN